VTTPRSPAGPRVAEPEAARPRVVVSWLSTGHGGAERSTADVIAGLAAIPSLRVSAVWAGEAGPAVSAAELTSCSVAGYRARLEAVCGAAGQVPRLLLGSHRTVEVDAQVGADLGIPVVTVVRAVLGATGSLRILDPATASLVKRPVTALGHWSALPVRWVGVSRASCHSLQRVGVDAGHRQVIYNGVSVPDRWSPLPDPDRMPVFLVMSRAERWKQIDLALTAFAAVADVARLVVVAQGPCLAELQALAAGLGIAERVSFRPWASSPYEYFDQADILLHVASREAFGRVVAEAGSAGRPAVVPDAGGAAEIVRPEQTGLVFEADSPTALAACLRRCVRLWHAGRLIEMGAAARSVVQRQFSLPALQSNYRRLVAGFVGPR